MARPISSPRSCVPRSGRVKVGFPRHDSPRRRIAAANPKHRSYGEACICFPRRVFQPLCLCVFLGSYLGYSRRNTMRGVSVFRHYGGISWRAANRGGQKLDCSKLSLAETAARSISTVGQNPKKYGN